MASKMAYQDGVPRWRPRWRQLGFVPRWRPRWRQLGSLDQTLCHTALSDIVRSVYHVIYHFII